MALKNEFRYMKKIIITLIAVVVITALFYLRFTQTRMVDLRGFTQGTTYMVKFYKPLTLRTLFDINDNYARRTKNRLEQLLVEFDNSLSGYNKESIVSKVNRNEDVVVDSLFNRVFKRSVELNKESAGLLDVSAGPLFELWGFGFKNGMEPTIEAIDSVKQFIGIDKVKIVDNRVVKDDNNITLNFNAIAQGYSVDIVCDWLNTINIDAYIVDIGGEIKAKGTKSSGEKWRVGIDKPVDNNNTPGANMQTIITLQDRSLATSGNYRKFYIKDGKKYSHTINPVLGKPVEHNLLSATVVADNAMDADAYATILMVLGVDKAKRFLDEHKEIDAYLVFSVQDKMEVYSTKGFDKLIAE